MIALSRLGALTREWKNDFTTPLPHLTGLVVLCTWSRRAVAGLSTTNGEHIIAKLGHRSCFVPTLSISNFALPSSEYEQYNMPLQFLLLY